MKRVVWYVGNEKITKGTDYENCKNLGLNPKLALEEVKEEDKPISALRTAVIEKFGVLNKRNVDRYLAEN